MAKHIQPGSVNSHLDSRGFRKQMPIKQHKIKFDSKPALGGGIKSKGHATVKAGGGVKGGGGDGIHRDSKGRFS